MSSITMLSSNVLASTRCNVGQARPTSALRNQPFTARPLRRTVHVRADKGSGPVDEAVKAAKDFQDTVEEKAQDLVKETQKNSGLNFENTNQQPGSPTRGPIAEAGSFSGLVPELANSRAAMVGMLAAFGAELATREPIFVQIQKAPIPILATFALIIGGSFAPIIRGADVSKIQGAGPFTQRAEIWNGRTAMVAFALLVAVETWKAGPGLVP